VPKNRWPTTNPDGALKQKTFLFSLLIERAGFFNPALKNFI